MRVALAELLEQWRIRPALVSIFPQVNEVLSKLEASSDRSARVDDRRQVLFSLLDAHELEAVSRARPTDGAAEFVGWLQSSGLPWGVVTNNGRRPVESIWHSLGWTAPPILVAREDVARLKPSPDGLVAMLDTLRVAASDLVVVGDSDHDITASGIIGSKSIHLRVPGGRELAYSRPTASAASFLAIRRELGRLQLERDALSQGPPDLSFSVSP
jgi:phosphoglycolate phosphatase-like HAD superfamily hydrolase